MDGFETRVRAVGYRTVAGVDEAGRGPLAGPVVAAAVVLPDGYRHPAINDSKALSPQARERAFSVIMSDAAAFSAAEATSEEIDVLNILRASLLAMQRAVERLPSPPDFVFVDGDIPIPPSDLCPVKPAIRRVRGRRDPPTLLTGLASPRGCVFSVACRKARAGRPPAGYLWCSLGQEPIVGGDSLCRSIMAASIVAKVTRDRMMEEYDRLYPGYGFSAHKGYGTKEHLEALRELGPSPIHRRTFRGVLEEPAARGGGERRGR